MFRSPVGQKTALFPLLIIALNSVDCQQKLRILTSYTHLMFGFLQPIREIPA